MKKALHRRDVVNHILHQREDLLVVAGLGAPTWDVTAAGDHPLSFPLWGAMGGAAMIGLGLALAQPKRKVLVVTGDGEMLMGLGSLAVIGSRKPRNLSVVVLDNEQYGETGMQDTVTAYGVDLAGIRELAKRDPKPETVVFLDRCFGGKDSLKANARKIFQDAGIEFRTI